MVAKLLFCVFSLFFSIEAFSYSVGSPMGIATRSGSSGSNKEKFVNCEEDLKRTLPMSQTMKVELVKMKTSKEEYEVTMDLCDKQYCMNQYFSSQVFTDRNVSENVGSWRMSNVGCGGFSINRLVDLTQVKITLYRKRMIKDLQIGSKMVALKELKTNKAGSALQFYSDDVTVRVFFQ